MRETTLVVLPGGENLTALRADRFLERLRGFMGRRIGPGDALLITPCSQIHCCFMRGPIDVVYLSGENKILAVTYAMPPNSFGKRVRGARRVLELYPGDAERLGLVPGGLLVEGGRE
jgi:uncharacterized membrane protein (UPF0127 family)